MEPERTFLETHSKYFTGGGLKEIRINLEEGEVVMEFLFVNEKANNRVTFSPRTFEEIQSFLSAIKAIHHDV